jgi:hypothetical protein
MEKTERQRNAKGFAFGFGPQVWASRSIDAFSLIEGKPSTSRRVFRISETP